MTVPPSGTLGEGESFFFVPSSASFANSLKGILDNSVWTTIKTGQDAFISADYPLLLPGSYPLPALVGEKPVMYASLKIDLQNPAFAFHTKLTTQPITGEYDLYTIVLHEIVHTLGFYSLINAKGNSTLGTPWSFYSRYDLRLKNRTSLGVDLPLIKTDPICNGYDAKFNTSVSSTPNSNGNLQVLEPGALPCVADHTDCNSAIKYVGSFTVSRSLQLGDQMCGRFSTYLSEAISTPICDDLLTCLYT